MLNPNDSLKCMFCQKYTEQLNEFNLDEFSCLNHPVNVKFYVDNLYKIHLTVMYHNRYTIYINKNVILVENSIVLINVPYFIITPESAIPTINKLLKLKCFL